MLHLSTVQMFDQLYNLIGQQEVCFKFSCGNCLAYKY